MILKLVNNWRFERFAGGLQRGLETFCKEGASEYHLYRKMEIVRIKAKVQSECWKLRE